MRKRILSLALPPLFATLFLTAAPGSAMDGVERTQEPNPYVATRQPAISGSNRIHTVRRNRVQGVPQNREQALANRQQARSTCILNEPTFTKHAKSVAGTAFGTAAAASFYSWTGGPLILAGTAIGGGAIGAGIGIYNVATSTGPAPSSFEETLLNAIRAGFPQLTHQIGDYTTTSGRTEKKLHPLTYDRNGEPLTYTAEYINHTDYTYHANTCCRCGIEFPNKLSASMFNIVMDPETESITIQVKVSEAEGSCRAGEPMQDYPCPVRWEDQEEAGWKINKWLFRSDTFTKRKFPLSAIICRTEYTENWPETVKRLWHTARVLDSSWKDPNDGIIYHVPSDVLEDDPKSVVLEDDVAQCVIM